MREAIQQAQACDPFYDVTDSDVEDARPEEIFLDRDYDADEELDHDGVHI